MCRIFECILVGDLTKPNFLGIRNTLTSNIIVRNALQYLPDLTTSLIFGSECHRAAVKKPAIRRRIWEQPQTSVGISIFFSPETKSFLSESITRVINNFLRCPELDVGLYTFSILLRRFKVRRMRLFVSSIYQTGMNWSYLQSHDRLGGQPPLSHAFFSLSERQRHFLRSEWVESMTR